MQPAPMVGAPPSGTGEQWYAKPSVVETFETTGGASDILFTVKAMFDTN